MLDGELPDELEVEIVDHLVELLLNADHLGRDPVLDVGVQRALVLWHSVHRRWKLHVWLELLVEVVQYADIFLDLRNVYHHLRRHHFLRLRFVPQVDLWRPLLNKCCLLL